MKNLFKTRSNSSIDPLHVLDKPLARKVTAKPRIIAGKLTKRFNSASQPSKASLIVVALASGVFGGYFIYQSFAATPVSANLWVDLNGGICARQATVAAYNDGTACSSFDAAWDKASPGDVIVVKTGVYPRQVITGDKTSETKIIGEDGTTIKGAIADCRPEFGAASVFCTEADYLTLENVTLDTGTSGNQAASTRIFADVSNVTFRNVNMMGDFPALYIEGSNFKWEGGTSGNPTPGVRTCDSSYGYPIIFAGGSNITIDGIKFNPMALRVGAGPYCGPDNTPHLETTRINGGSDINIKNSTFVDGSDAGSGHIFSSVAVSRLKLINNYFGRVNATYWIQATNSGNSDWSMLYNTFTQGGSLSASGQTWVGNLGVYQGCSGTHIKNVWSGSGSCGTDTFVGSTSLGIGSDGRLASTSPAINAAETDTSSDYCTGSLVGSVDFEGTTRPQGTACDAGADEYGAPSSGGATANIWVDTNGGTCTRSATAAAYNDAAACSSMQAALTAAQTGDMIRMKAGTYGAQNINVTKSTAGTIVEAEPNTIIGQLSTAGAFYEIRNVTGASGVGWDMTAAGTHDITLRNAHFSGSEIYLNAANAYNISWIGGSLRNHTDTNRYPTAFFVYAPAGSTLSNMVVDGVTFDKISRNLSFPDDHYEVIRVDGNVNGFTLKNSTFTNNNANTATIFFTTNNGPKPQNIVMENNFFGSSAPAFFTINMNYQGNVCSNWTMRYNTFLSATVAGGNCSYSNIAWTGNLAPAGNCQGTSFTNNVWYGSGSSCGSSDKVIASPGLGGTGGFYLQSGSGAIDAAGTGTNCIATDHDGQARPVGTACDAGADEFGTSADPPPPSSDTTAPTTSITAPTNGATINGTYNITASASDNVGVTKVEFYQGSTKLGEDTTSPYDYGWDTTTVANATYSLTAKAFDAAGNTTTSTTASVTVSNTAPPPTSSVPMAAYAFNEGNGTTAADSSGNNNTLTMPSTAWTTAGKYGNAASFNGTTSSFAQRADSASFDLGSTGTIETWFKPSATGVWHGLIAKGSANDNNAHNYAIEINNANQVMCIIGNGTGSNTATSTTALSAGVFYHLACTWDGTSLKLYINGTQNASITQSITPAGNAASLLVGLFGGNADPANGVIDDVRIYNKALTASEVSSDMNTAVSSGPADTTAPSAPTSLRLNGTVSATSVPLTWNASTDNVGVTKYNVLRGDVVIAQVNAPTVSYTDNTAVASTSYSYIVQAVDGANNTSPNSNTLAVTTPAPPADSTPPPAPTLSASAVSSSQINLSWNAVTDASGIAGYNIYRGTSSTSITTKLNSSLVTTTSFGDTGLTAGTTYYYQVEAVDGAGNTSTRSNTASATTQGGTTTTAQRFVATTGADSGSCSTQSTACRTLNYAYSQAAAGNTIELAAGTYGSGSIAFRSGMTGAPVTVRPASGAIVNFTDLNVDVGNITIKGPNFNIRSMDIGNSGDASTRRFDITLDNLNIDAQDTLNTDAMFVGNTQNLNLRNSRVGNTMAGTGPNDTAKSVMTCAGNSTCHNINMVFENNLFYDADTPSGSLAHLECIWAGGVQGFTLRKNTFRDCTFFDVFITVVVVNNQPQPKDHIFEDNVFGQTVHPDGYDFGYDITLHSDVQPNNFVFSRNTIEGAIATANGGGAIQAGGWRITGNIIANGVWLAEPQPQGCRSGIVFEYNVMPNTCGSNTTTASYTAIRDGWVGPRAAYTGADDFHLKSTSPAINKGRPADAGTLDYDGVSRANPPDAGAYEDQGAPPPDTTPPSVSITTPVNGSTVSGIIMATATAADNVAVAGVQFKLDGANLGTEDMTYPYNASINTQTYINGSHILTAVARDSSSLTTTSATVTINIQNVDTVAPSPPAILCGATTQPSSSTASKVALAWPAATDNGNPASGIKHYLVQRNGATIAIVSAAATAICNGTSYQYSYTDSNLPTGNYSYVIRAVDNSGSTGLTSAASTAYNTAINAVPGDTVAPTTPTNLTATPVSKFQINLAWNTSTDTGGAGLAGYNVYRGTSAASITTKLNSALVTTTSFGSTGLKGGTTYYYQVEAVDGVGNKSAKTAIVSATTFRNKFYRLSSTQNHTHFYTTSDAERAYATRLGYRAEGNEGYVALSPATGLSPFYRLFNPQNSAHFYTTSLAERNYAVKNLGFRSEGNEGYIALRPATGYMALYRLLNPGNGAHFYTTKAIEKDYAVKSLSFRYEGIAGYVGDSAEGQS